MLGSLGSSTGEASQAAVLLGDNRGHMVVQVVDLKVVEAMGRA